MSASHPTTSLAPNQPYFVDGLDWSWAYVIFKEIPGFPGYAIGSNGRVWSSVFHRPPSPDRRTFVDCNGVVWWERVLLIHADGRPMMSLSRDKKAYRKLVNRLVLRTFRGDRPGLICRHFPDKDPTNNNLRNLLWGTYKQNEEDKKYHGTFLRGAAKGNAKLDEMKVHEIRRLSASGMTYDELAAIFKVNRANIGLIVTRKTWAWV